MTKFGTVSRIFHFDAAHKIECFGQGHKCARLHGHTWRVVLFISGVVNPETGIVLDYYDIDAAWKVVFEEIDHRFLNEVEAIGIPSTENIAAYLWSKLVEPLTGKYYQLSKIALYEGATDCFEFFGTGQEKNDRAAQ
jgi:6-pyruvoyltetrahydropterin/6-carboxytetrahydropterin synthase